MPMTCRLNADYIPIVYLLEEERDGARRSHYFLIAIRLYMQWGRKEGGGGGRKEEGGGAAEAYQENKKKNTKKTRKNLCFHIEK